MICDFCSAPHPAWCYPCPDFLLNEPAPSDIFHHASEGGWTACEACSALIEQDQRTALADRVVQLLRVKYPQFLVTAEDRRETLLTLLQTYQTFFRRHGPRERLDILS